MKVENCFEYVFKFALELGVGVRGPGCGVSHSLPWDCAVTEVSV